MRVIELGDYDQDSKLDSWAVTTVRAYEHHRIVGEREEPEIGGRYRIEAYPSTYLLDPEGKIVYEAIGVQKEELLRTLAALGLETR